MGIINDGVDTKNCASHVNQTANVFKYNRENNNGINLMEIPMNNYYYQLFLENFCKDSICLLVWCLCSVDEFL